MILDNIYQLPSYQVKCVEWLGDDLYFDLELFELDRNTHDEFWVLNPEKQDHWDQDIRHYVTDLPTTKKCIVISYNGQWYAKIFKRGWYPYHGYETVDIIKPKLIWTKNPDLDKLMTFENSPFGTFDPDKWDREYKLIWYIDPRVNPLEDKVWAISCEPLGKVTKGIKDMGYVMPQLDIEFNDHLPNIGIDVDACYPAFYHLDCGCGWYLDSKHTPEASEDMLVLKFTPRYRKPRAWIPYGVVSPDIHIEYNNDLGELDYELDYVIPWHDFTFEHVWMLDRKHLHDGEEDIWAFKIRVSNELEGSKVIDYIAPSAHIETNKKLEGMKFNVDYVIPWHDLTYSHIWYMNVNEEKVWAATLQSVVETEKVKDMGTIEPIMPEKLNVVFISYNEPNAEENWNRVLEKAPYAKRVHGVTGIFNAHQRAAEIADTDMFYVVDGDAWLTDDWEFNFQPTVYDRNCTFIWQSKNPVNDLVYGYGGVKLFSRSKVLNAKKWTKLDFATTVMNKLKVVETVSNISMFNTDEFSAWRSSFRECVKLQQNLLKNPKSIEDNVRLNAWLTKGKDAKFGTYVIEAAHAAVQYANTASAKELLYINDVKWLEQRFQSVYADIKL